MIVAGLFVRIVSVDAADLQSVDVVHVSAPAANNKTGVPKLKLMLLNY